MKAMHSPPGQHEVLLTNGSNHTFEVRLKQQTACIQQGLHTFADEPYLC